MKKLRWNGVIGYRYTNDEGAKEGITIDSAERDLTEAAGEDLRINLTTVGGSVFDGIQIMSLLREYSGKTTIVIDGTVASAGTIISMGADEIVARPSSVWMIHNAAGAYFGDYKELRKRADELEGYTNIIAQEYARKTGSDIEEIRSMMDEETYFFGEEIITAGFADTFEEVGQEPIQNRQRAKQLVARKIKAIGKRAPQNIRDFEKYLRDSGYSKSQAVAIASGGFRAINDGGTNHNQEGETVTKQETLDSLKNLKANNEITLSEVANTIGLGDQVVNQAEQAKKDEEYKKMSDRVVALEQQIDKSRSDIVSARLDKEFGTSNSLRDYAQDILASKTVDELDEAIAEFKTRPVAKTLAAKKVDPFSNENMVEDSGNATEPQGLVI